MTSLAPSRSCRSAGCTATANSSPWVSTTICRLRPFTCLPASYPRGPLFPWSSFRGLHRLAVDDGPAGAGLAAQEPSHRGEQGIVGSRASWGAGHRESPARSHLAAKPKSSGRPIARAAGREATDAMHNRCAARTGWHSPPPGGSTWRAGHPASPAEPGVPESATRPPSNPWNKLLGSCPKSIACPATLPAISQTLFKHFLNGSTA